MQQKLRVKLRQTGKKRRVKVRFLIFAFVAVAGMHLPKMVAEAESCPDLKIIFARGSGAENETSEDYLNFKTALETKLETTSLNYEFVDLDYPAVSVGIENLDVMLGAFFSGGESYEFGESVDAGVKKLMGTINGACPETKYVLGGYSQGAMVVSKALGSLNSERVIYAATFGDPKIYLPEGEGVIPAACKGENLSDYRAYVPDCQAYKGLLGAYIPYEPAAYVGKLGTWCNKRDLFCSSHFSVSDHTGYVSDNLYEDASWTIFDKILSSFGIERTTYSIHDTAFLIDSTGSMAGMINQYKAEALRLAEETLANGGRVALYDYRDLRDPYEPVKHCDFENCTLEIFANELDKIEARDGGDTPESLLSAAWQVMQEQTWQLGSTKSLVVLTDANYLSPDVDGITLDQVVQLSKHIDPINIYIITTNYYGDFYAELAGRTDGLVVTNFDELSLLTQHIIERYDSLPKVEEGEADAKPSLKINSAVWADKNTVRINFETTGERTVVIVNDTVLGMTEETEITIEDVKLGETRILLAPVSENIRGETVEVINSGYGATEYYVITTIPKAPNTGRA